MSLLRKSLKIITSAPQLPENKQPFSPDPQNPWGPSSVLQVTWILSGSGSSGLMDLRMGR